MLISILKSEAEKQLAEKEIKEAQVAESRNSYGKKTLLIAGATGDALALVPATAAALGLSVVGSGVFGILKVLHDGDNESTRNKEQEDRATETKRIRDLSVERKRREISAMLSARV